MTNEAKFENVGGGISIGWANLSNRYRVCFTAWRTVGDAWTNRAQKTDWQLMATVYGTHGEQAAKLQLIMRDTTRKAAAAEFANEINNMIEAGHF